MSLPFETSRRVIRTGSKGVGLRLELDPLYADRIVDRYQRFAGKLDVLERTGTSLTTMGARDENMR